MFLNQHGHRVPRPLNHYWTLVLGYEIARQILKFEIISPPDHQKTLSVGTQTDLGVKGPINLKAHTGIQQNYHKMLIGLPKCLS